MLTKSVVRTGVNPNVIHEKNHPGECVVSELGSYQCRGNRVVSGGAGGVPHNAVLLKADGHFDIVVLEGVKAGETAMRGGIENGPCELSEAKLDWSQVVVTNAADGPDAGTDNTAENDAATIVKRDTIRAEMRALGIKLIASAPTIPAGR